MSRTNYARADIYAKMCQRHIAAKAVADQALRSLERLPALGLYAPGVEAVIDELFDIVNGPPPPREWRYAIGLTVTAILRGRKHGGTYTLTVEAAETAEGFKLVVSGPEGEAQWWPGCGFTEMQVLNRVGCHRHTITRFFGLKDKISGHTKNNSRSPFGSAPPPNPNIPITPRRVIRRA